MCDAQAVDREHVPPRCFIPKLKDLKEGQDLRKKLQTVPACKLHNSGKSKDDEYFLNVVASLDLINEVGRNHYRNQIRRQNVRNSSIIARFADRALEVDGRFAHQVEIARLDSFVYHFAHALYFLHYSERWEQEINWLPEFAARPPGAMDETMRMKAIEENDLLFQNVAFYGENPIVFKYQVLESDEAVLMRAYFYEGCRVYLEFTHGKQRDKP